MEAENDLDSELRCMPKPPVGDVVTSIGAQAKAILFVGLGLLALAGTLQGISYQATARRPWEGAAALFCGLSMAPFVLAAILGLWVYVQGKKQRQLAKGEYYVRWTHAPDQWAGHCALTSGSTSNIVRTITLVCCGGALLLALAAHQEGNAVSDSIIKHYAIFGMVGTTAGFLIGTFCRYCGNLTHRLKQTRTAQSIIGPAGIYMTGQFWPMATVGQQLSAVTIASDDPEQVRFVFNMQTNHGTREMRVFVPIPPGQEKIAGALVSLIQRDHLAQPSS